MSESGKALNAEAGAVDPASSVGAQNSSSLSSSLVLSSSSLRTLVEQGDQHLEYLAERVVRELWVSSVGMVHSKPMRAREVVLKALRELAALLSPVEGRQLSDLPVCARHEGTALLTESECIACDLERAVEGRTNDDDHGR